MRVAARLGAKPVELLERRDKSLLRHIVGLGWITDRGQRRPEDRAPIAFHQLAERLHVAGLRPADQGVVHGRGGIGGIRGAHTVYRGHHRGSGWVVLGKRRLTVVF